MNLTSPFKTILPATAIAVTLTACGAYSDLGGGCRGLGSINSTAGFTEAQLSAAAAYADSHQCDNALQALSTRTAPTIVAVQAAPKPMTRTEIPLHRSAGGSYYLPVTVIQTLSVPFALDTGSELIQIPLDVYLVLKRNGTISSGDERGSGAIITADGSSHKEPRFVIHELKVGDRVVTDVLGTVSPANSVPLLGEEFLARLGSYTIDNQRHVLTLG